MVLKNGSGRQSHCPLSSGLSGGGLGGSQVSTGFEYFMDEYNLTFTDNYDIR